MIDDDDDDDVIVKRVKKMTNSLGLIEFMHYNA
jgi:hypothetical protein